MDPGLEALIREKQWDRVFAAAWKLLRDGRMPPAELDDLYRRARGERSAGAWTPRHDITRMRLGGSTHDRLSTITLLADLHAGGAPESRKALEDDLTDLLVHPASDHRGHALAMIRSYPARRLTPLVALLVRDADARMAADAIDVLTTLEAKESLADIVPHLRSPDDALRRAALQAVATLGPRAELVNHCRDLLQAGHVADALVTAHGRNMVELRGDVCALLGRLAGPELAMAIESLSEIGDASSIPALAVHLDDAASRVRVAEAVLRLGPSEHERRAEDVLASHVAEAIGADSALDSRVVATAIARGGRLAGCAIGLLDDRRADVRRTALRAIGDAGASAHADRVARFVRDKDAGVRCAAVDTLVQLDANRHAEAIRALLADKSHEVCEAAIRAMVRFRRAEAAPDLVRFLDGKRMDTALEAADALVRLEARSLLPEIAKRLKKSASVPVVSALHVLQRMGHAECAAGALKHLSHAEGTVRNAAIDYLRAVFGDRYRPQIEQARTHMPVRRGDRA